ncbi:unnamed protein product [Adineta steineri]|uniref:Uncharacterized protein n=1 Tax=Adineta steineri TaxID=433720 RepID=A0A819C5H5_9BILA|nr:unnamed protein product [Adineta steineri]
MSGQPNNYIFSILILFTFICSNVYSVTCRYDQITCHTYLYTWCCETYQYCGSTSGSCLYYTTQAPVPTPSSDLPPSLLTVIIVVPIVLIVTCLSCWMQSQKHARSSMIDTNNEIGSYTYHQQSRHRPGRTFQVHPVYDANGRSPIPSIYEEAPPSYEAAMCNAPPKHSLVLSPPVAVTVDQNSNC